MIEAALAALAVIGVGAVLVRRGINEAATTLCRELAPHWTPRREFRDVALDEVAGDDGDRLVALTDELVAAGLRHLYDIQDLTLSTPARGVYYRVFTDDRGTTKGCIYLPLRDEQPWSLESELDDGRFLITEVAVVEPSRRPDLPWAETLMLGAGTDVASALHRHRARLEQLGAGVTPVDVGDRDAALASWQRAVARVAGELRRLSDPIVFQRLYAHRPKWFERAVCREALRRLDASLPAARAVSSG